MNETVSVIMPAYNSEPFVAASIESVLAQTYSDLELLIVDDVSSDKTASVVESYMRKDPRIRFFRQPQNAGAAEARNRAIGEARGRYIAFLDSDDLWLPEKLHRQIGAMRTEKWPFTYTAYTRIDEQGQPLGEVGVPSTVTYAELLKTCIIGCLTAVYDTEAFGKVLMPSIRKRQDFGLWLRLLKMTPRAYGIREPLALYRVRSDSISSNKKSAALYTWRLYREVERLSLFWSLWFFSHYAVRGVLRHKFPAVARALGVLERRC